MAAVVVKIEVGRWAAKADARGAAAMSAGRFALLFKPEAKPLNTRITLTLGVTIESIQIQLKACYEIIGFW